MHVYCSDVPQSVDAARLLAETPTSSWQWDSRSA